MEPTGYGQVAPDRLDATFAALADPTRRAILARLASGEASVMELAEPFAMSQPAISKDAPRHLVFDAFTNSPSTCLPTVL